MYQGINIDVKDIKEVIPYNNKILIVPRKKYIDLASNLSDESIKYFVCVDNIKPADMQKIKYEYIRHIKLSLIPSDRVADYEFRDDNGIPDFARQDRLINGRKTREERQLEIQQDMLDIKEFEKAGLECEFMKDNLRDKLQGN